MFSVLSRRRFVGYSTGALAGALTGFPSLSFLDALPAFSAEPESTVRFSREIEPLVTLIEDTPRKELLEKIAGEIHRGRSYQDLLAAVFLAGVRGIQPRPVGFKFHAVLVINSAHLATLAATDSDRWLPLFWALDNYKASQAANKTQGGWMMPPVQESRLPGSDKARQAFIDAMDNWDEEATDRAIVAFGRSSGAAEVFEQFWRYGARDFRDIGHKAIYAANAYRTLQAIGYRYAEPVMRSLAYAMLEHEGGNPAKRDDERDRAGRNNAKRAAELAHVGRTGKVSAEAASDLLACLRTATADEASVKVVELLKKGIDPASIWDGLFLTAGELLMRQPGIVGLHCMTSANALHFAWQMTGSDETRRFLLLQTAAFLALFREAMKGRGRLSDVKIDAVEKADIKTDIPTTVSEIFSDLGKDRMLAARKTLTFLEGDPGQIGSLMMAARRLVFAKGRDSHDYKFSSAALEDYYHLTPAWRGRYAAASMFNLKASTDADNDLIRRTRVALTRS
jgi:hypothetical protein